MALTRIPPSPNLYIGSLFTLRATTALKAANITHVVSALSAPLDQKLLAGYRHLHVEVDDVEDENLLRWFPIVNRFLAEGLQGEGGVVVVCVASKSRSATLILAHLLATNPVLTPASALAHLRASHPPADPNPGFMAQLALYHRMGCPSSLDTQPLYQRWLNERSAAESAAVGMAPQMEGIRCGDEVERGGGSAPLSSLPGEEEEKEKETKKKESTYRCRRCRTPLATTAYLIPHTPPPPPSAPKTPHLPISSPQPQQPCAHLFLDPLSWMRPELEKAQIEGRLECPKCRQNVGKYAWQGMRCSCGGWVVPGICLARGRVDEVGGVGGGGRL